VVAFSINESDIITAVSNNLREETYKIFDIEKDIEVIHNFVDVQRFSKKPIDAFKKALAPNGERVLMHASNFRAIKRVQDVIQIFAKVHKQIPSKLMMVGDGPERHMAEDLCRTLNICNDVRFVGKQEQMEEIMVISDLFLLTSDYESFGLSALEAMAAHVPVVSSNAGGLPEINIHGETGFLAPVGQIKEMAEYAITILKDDDTLAEFKQRAYEQACRFDIEHIVPRYEEMYERVLTPA
jgi:L-malate glycosyltransferase